MPTLDLKAMADGVISAVKGYVDKASHALSARIDAIEKQPMPKDGKDGDPGKDGADGIQGEAGAKGDPGMAGDKGDRGEKGEKGDKGDAGDRGMDGKSVTLEEAKGLLDTMQASWALDFERRAQDLLQKAVDRIPGPKDGKDGTDGLGFDDLQAQFDGERTVTLKFQRGEQTKAFDMVLPIVLDRGVFRDGSEYEKGDSVTWAGSSWIAQQKTLAKPDTANSGWRLAVKRGRDGKDGRDGIDKTKAVQL